MSTVTCNRSVCSGPGAACPSLTERNSQAVRLNSFRRSSAKLSHSVRGARFQNTKRSSTSICKASDDMVIEAEIASTSSTPERFAGVRADLKPSEPITLTGEVDEAALLAAADFPIPADDLIQLCKAFIQSQVDGDADKWFADDFRFVAPVVGPLNKERFTSALKGFELREAIPDLESNFHHFRVDPFEPNRVYYTVKFKGTNTGKFFGFLGPSNKSIESPPQAQSVVFNTKGEVTKFTIGYVLDKEVGNTGGLGGVYGLLYASGFGLPFPEGQPWKPSPLYALFMQGNQSMSSDNENVIDKLKKFFPRVGN